MIVRTVKLISVLALVSVASFMLVEFIPGSTVDVLAPPGASEEQRRALTDAYSLGAPVQARFFAWLRHVATGDLGKSLVSRQDVGSILGQRLPATAELAGLSIALALVVAVPVAVYTAWRADSWLDRGANAAVSAAMATPSFLSALLLLYVFAVRLHWFPISGWQPFAAGVGPHFRSLVLPVLTLAIMLAATFVRVLRTDLFETLAQDYVGAARAIGLPPRRVLFLHALRPSSFSLVTVLGVSIGRLLGGTVIVESIFSIPGVGNMLVQAITSRDYPVVQGVVLVIALAYVLLNTIVDASYALLDPRLRRSGTAAD